MSSEPSVPASAPKGMYIPPLPVAANMQSSKSEGFFIIERFKENPFVFAGLAVTVGALVRGVSTMTKGDEIQQNRMMRLRIGGQAFTVAAFIAGCALGWHGPIIETVEKWKMRHGYPPHPLFKSTLDREAAMRAWESEDMRLPSRKL